MSANCFNIFQEHTQLASLTVRHLAIDSTISLEWVMKILPLTVSTLQTLRRTNARLRRTIPQLSKWIRAASGPSTSATTIFY